MTAVLNTLRSVLIWITASGLILLAVLVTVLRLVLPMASDYRDQVAAELGALLDHRVEIGALDARWHLLGPRLYLDDLSVHGEEGGPPLLRVERLDLGVRTWRSLLHRQPRFHSVRVLGADVHVHRDHAGRYHISGAGTSALEEAPRADRLLRMLAGITFRLEASRLRYTDDVLVLDYGFDDLNVDVAVESAGLRLAGKVFLPPELGRDLTLGIDLRGEPGDPDTWRGRVYVRGEGIDIGRLPDDALLRRARVAAGTLDLELWSRLGQGRLERVRSRLRVRDVRLDMPGDVQGTPPRLDQVGVDALWEQRSADGWQLRLHRARLRHEDGAETEMGLSLAFRQVDGERRVWGEAEGARVDELLPLLLAHEVLTPDQQALMTGLRPAGEFPGLRFHGRWTDPGEPRFAVAGEFRELSLEPHERIPGLQGLRGGFSLNQDGGELSLESRGVRFEYPRLFADSLWLDVLQGDVDWLRTAEGYRIHGAGVRLRNADARAEGEFTLDLGSESRMELRVDFADADGSQMGRYLPRGIMPENTYEWLKRSIVDGRVPEGELVFRGPLKPFPIEEGEGEFQVRARVEAGVLDYWPGWPVIRDISGELIFDDRGMRAASASGQVFDVRIEDAEVHIADYRQAVLEVDGEARGPLAHLLRYVRESSLGSGLDDLLDDTVAEGDGGLSLSLRLPLSSRQGGVAATRVSGKVDLEGNRLRLTNRPVDFHALSGSVAFTEATVEAEGVTARFNDEAVTLGARLRNGGPLVVRARGMQPASALTPYLPVQLQPHFRGRSLWTVELEVPIRRAGPVMLSLRSDLEGVRSSLPPPLDKPADARVPLQVRVPLTQTGTPVRFRYGEVLSGVLTGAGTDRGEPRGELRFNDGEARMPDAGLRLAGRVERLPVDAWHALTEASGGRAQGAAMPLEGAVTALELSLGELVLGSRVLHEVRLHADRDHERWRARVDAPALRGRIEVPRNLQGVAPIILDLELLDLDRMAPEEAAGGEADERLDPRSLPGLRGGVATLIHDGRTFADLRIEAARIREGLQIHHLQLSSAHGHAAARITGDWRVAASGRHQTQLRFELQSDNVGNALTDLGFEHAFDRGQARIEGQMRWPDAATRFTWEGLQGTGRVEIENGRLVEVDPGAGRLLGLFSLNMLPRRLALDFRDVFQRGFLFDSLTGTVRLVDGDAYTSDLTIHGAAAVVRIDGRTGIVARDHDQRIVVTPRVGSALPLAGVILGGPVAGAAVFILDRLLGMGRSIDEAAQVEYRVTGTWQEPVVEAQARPVDPDT